jgi:hypothetical protein
MASPKSSLALDSGTDEVARWAEPLSVARGGGGGLVSDVNGPRDDQGHRRHQLYFYISTTLQT